MVKDLTKLSTWDIIEQINKINKKGKSKTWKSQKKY